MVYEWEDKKSECFRLYVTERRPLDEVMDYFRERGFKPSKRAFQTQFKRWNFPTKQNPAYKNERLVARIKELWEQNTGQGDMVRVLNEEGFAVKEREIMRVRVKHRWLLRIPNGQKSAALLTESLDDPVQESGDAVLNENVTPIDTEALIQVAAETAMGLETEEESRRQERLSQMQTESDERWRTKKRRRRIRGWANLPADPAGPPRFPSETTLDESKIYLSLDNDLYRRIREEFQNICQQEGVVKKTVAGPEKWTQIKEQLIQESEHLKEVWSRNISQELDHRAISLDVICTDVTKRMRTMERKMTIADAKNILGLNPEDSREIRHTFYAKLKNDRFTSKLETGNEHWEALKNEWLAQSPILQRLLQPEVTDPHSDLKTKAIEFICRDVMKRFRDDQIKADPSKKKWAANGPNGGPGPARAKTIDRTMMGRPGIAIPAEALDQSNPEPDALVTALQAPADIQIDPSLLLAATDPSVAAAQAASRQLHASFANEAEFPALPTPIPTYIRLHPQSAVQCPPHLWLSSLRSHSLAELHYLATEKHPGTQLLRVTGIVREEDGTELSYNIDYNVELKGYLDHVSGGKVMFSVILAAEFT